MQTEPTILYVEDDAGSRNIMKVLLCEMMGLSNVTIFEDSSDFISRVQQMNPLPDVVLLDIHMSPLNGFEMLRLLREQTDYPLQQTPIIALTASVMNEEIHMLRTAGFNGVIAKPIDIDTFPDLLYRILQGEQHWSIFS
jgi:two-component system, NarL family, sensor histidine kinase BarA